MLNLYIKDFLNPPEGLPYIHDVEGGFIEIEINKVPKLADALLAIEQATPCNEDVFTDRFGVGLYYKYLSTGCKAALCVAAFPDKLINVEECGFNALDAIIHLYTEGNILLVSFNRGITSYPSNIINVKCNGFVFTNADALNQYLLYDIKEDMESEPSYEEGWVRA